MKIIDVSTPKFPNTFAMVDDEDFDRINAHEWTAFQCRPGATLYARRGVWVGEKKKIARMHREILGENCPKIPDHRDGNGLNNQKENLRPATQSQNCFNKRCSPNPNKKSKYRGIKRAHSIRESWEARIKINKKTTHIGSFPTEELAYAAYLETAKRVYGDFVPAAILTPQKAGAPMVWALAGVTP